MGPSRTLRQGGRLLGRRLHSRPGAELGVGCVAGPQQGEATMPGCLVSHRRGRAGGVQSVHCGHCRGVAERQRRAAIVHRGRGAGGPVAWSRESAILRKPTEGRGLTAGRGPWSRGRRFGHVEAVGGCTLGSHVEPAPQVTHAATQKRHGHKCQRSTRSMGDGVDVLDAECVVVTSCF